MNTILKTVFNNPKGSTAKSIENTPSLHSCKSAPTKKVAAGGFKKISIKLNQNLAITIQISQEKSAELTGKWLLDESKKRFEETSAASKYQKEIAGITALRTAEGFVPLDYYLTLMDNNLDALPDKLSLQAIFCTENDRGDEVRKVSLQNFEICGCLGRGAFARVYLARKKQNGKFYAIKQVKKGSLEPKEVDRLMNERDILRAGNRAGSVKLYYAFQTDEFCYFVLQYCPGGDLRKLIRELGPLTEKEAKFYVKEVLYKIEALHEKGILYRDLKSENLLLGLNGSVYLADFGLSKLIGDPKLNLSLCGTPEFLAPELLRKEPYTFAVDHYNIGTLAYELVTSKPPFIIKKDLQTLYDEILTKEPSIPSHLSRDLQDFLRGILHKSPSMRLGNKGIEDIINHPWLADAPSVPKIQLSHLSIQKTLKKLDKDSDKGILIDSKDWFRNPTKKPSNRNVVGFSIHSVKNVDRLSELESPTFPGRRPFKSATEERKRSSDDRSAFRRRQQEEEQQKQAELSLISETTHHSLQDIPSINEHLGLVLPSCDLGDADELEGEIIGNLQLQQLNFEHRSSHLGRK